MGLKKEIVLTVDPPPHKIPTPSGAVAPPVGSSSSPFCWSPMEKLILHLSPVTRRKSLRNSNQPATSANRRTMSEPNKNRMLLLNNRSSNANAHHAQQHLSNGGFAKKASLSSDLKAVAVAAVHEVLRAEIVATFRCVVQGFADE